MDNLFYWKALRNYSVIQTACLICDVTPTDNDYYFDRIEGFEPIFAALTSSIISGSLKAAIRRQARTRGWDETPGSQEEFTKKASLFRDHEIDPEEQKNLIIQGVIYRTEPDWHKTTIHVDDIREWLIDIEFTDNFFFRYGNHKRNQLGPDYLDPNHEHFAPKLAAAIRAWQAVTSDPTLMRRKKSAKDAMEKWLINNAEELGLIKKDGSINNKGIKEVARTANWEQKGGAPKQSFK